MKRNSYVILLIAALGLMLLAGCAAKKAFWGDPETGLILRYQAPEKAALRYSINNLMIQNIEVMGNEMETKIKSDYLFSMQSKETQKDPLSLEITIDSVKMHVTSPQGSMVPAMDGVIGKSFDMLMSPLGKELDVSGAKALSYKTESGQERDISSDFQALFPNVAENPLVIGDTWTSRDTVDISQEDMKILLTFENVNTLAGLETVNGMECVKITTKVTGVMEGGGVQGGMDLAFELDLEGEDTWYFAYKKGIFVQTVSEGFGEGSIAVSGPQEMTIPMTLEMLNKTTLKQ
jgi:hypothetical protein